MKDILIVSGFIIILLCVAFNEYFRAASYTLKLSNRKLDEIKKHLTELGFKYNDYLLCYIIDYNNCKDILDVESFDLTIDIDNEGQAIYWQTAKGSGYMSFDMLLKQKSIESFIKHIQETK